MMLLAYMLVTLAAVFVWPTVRLWRRERVNALVLPRDDTAAGVIAGWFRVNMAVLLACVVAMAVGVPGNALGELAWLYGQPVRAAGWIVLVAALGWIAVAQAQMGSSWRVGVDPGERPALVTAGLFGRSRNPIFLGMRAMLVGLVLVEPNAATVAPWLLGEALMQIQVRLEEAHLDVALGASYAVYRAQVPRWL